ncbi:hypothetical protein NKH04_13510 [Mesorhizobium sp. M1365]
MPAILGGTAGDPSASRHAARKQGLQMKSDHANPSHLRDFTTDARVLLIAGIAVVVATAGLFAGIALLKLIRLATNIAYFGQFTLADLKLQDTPLGRPKNATVRLCWASVSGAGNRIALPEGYNLPRLAQSST